MTFTIVSFSSGRLSAIIRVRATSVLSAIRLFPSSVFFDRCKFCTYQGFFKFSFPEDVFYVAANDGSVLLKQFSYLRLGKPYSVI